MEDREPVPITARSGDASFPPAVATRLRAYGAEIGRLLQERAAFLQGFGEGVGVPDGARMDVNLEVLTYRVVLPGED